MLHIILFILKILGCILLAVIGLLLISLLIVLFVPVKYYFNGSYIEQPDLLMKISWLFGLIKANVEFKNQQLQVQAKLAWKSLYTMKKDFSKKDSVDMVSGENVKDDSEFMSEELEADSIIEEVQQPNQTKAVPKMSSETETATVLIEPKTSVDKEVRRVEKIDQDKSKKNKEKKKDSDAKKQDLFERIVLKIEQIMDKLDLTAEKIEEKLEQFSCRLDKAERFLSAECTQNSLELARAMFVSIVKHVAPKHVKGRVHFGLDKPSSTGKVLGYASALYPLYADDIRIEPDFEKKVFDGDLNIKGAIQLYIFLFWALRMILCKDVRKLIKYVKHLKK